MSQENVELAHRTFDAFNRRDLEVFLAFIDPDVEFVSGSGLIEGGSRHGHDGIRGGGMSFSASIRIGRWKFWRCAK